MDNKNNPFNPGNNNEPKMPKFNMNWLYILVIIATAMLLFTNTGNSLLSSSGASQEATYTKFKEYVQKGYAKNVVVNSDQKNLKMYVKPKHIQDVFHMSAKQVGPNPYVSVDFGSVENVDTYLSAEQNAGKITEFSYENAKSNPLLNMFLSSILPLALLVVFWIWMMRRMSGGGNTGGGGGIFSFRACGVKVFFVVVQRILALLLGQRGEQLRQLG